MRHDHRFPRTLREAFGPYAAPYFAEEFPASSTGDKLVLLTCLLACLFAVLFL